MLAFDIAHGTGPGDGFRVIRKESAKSRPASGDTGGPPRKLPSMVFGFGKKQPNN